MAALNKHHIEEDSELIIKCDTYDDAIKKTKFLLNFPKPPDGIFAVNDLTAIGAMHTVKKSGLNVPEDIAIIGYTNGQISTMTNPTLSSVEQSGYEMGQIAVKLLINKIEKPDLFCKSITKILKTKFGNKRILIKKPHC